MASLLASGRTFLIIGDVTAARLAFRRAAERGDAQASLALGGTFDPLVLKSLGAVGVAADFRYAYWCVLATLAGAVAMAISRLETGAAREAGFPGAAQARPASP